MKIDNMDTLVIVLENENNFDAKDNYNVYRAVQDAIKRNGAIVRYMSFTQNTSVNIVGEEMKQSDDATNVVMGTLTWDKKNIPQVFTTADMEEPEANSLYQKEVDLKVRHYLPSPKTPEVLPPEDIVEAIMFQRMQLREDAHGSMDSEDEIKQYGADMINALISQRIYEHTKNIFK